MNFKAIRPTDCDEIFARRFGIRRDKTDELERDDDLDHSEIELFKTKWII